MHSHRSGIALSAAFCLALSAGAQELPTAEQLMARYTEAVGGEALAKVKNRSLEFEFEMPMQGIYSFGVDYWAPGRHYMMIDLSSSGVANFEAGVVDGVAWQSHPMSGMRRLTGDEERLGLWGASLNPFASWQEFFEKAQTVGEETIDGRNCYKVVFTPAEGAPVTFYFDAETGLAVRDEMPGPAGTTIVSDRKEWQETNGITSARLIEVGGPQAYTLRFTRVAYDVDDIPEDAFALPATLPAAAP